MKTTVFLLLLFSLLGYAQDPERNENHQGFLFSTSLGISGINISDPYQHTSALSGSFPNFRFGYSFTNRISAGILLPGTIYTYKGPDRSRDRGFEGLIPFIQYWPLNKWWIMGGAGFTFDAPAFYDIKNETEADFYTGPSFIASTGYEIWKRGKFVLDVQARVHAGFSVLPDGHRNGIASTLLIGFNWY